MAVDLHKDEELERKSLEFELIKRLWVYIRPQAWKLIVVVVCLLVITCIELTAIHAIGDALDTYIRPYGSENALAKDEMLYGIYMTAITVTVLYISQMILTFFEMNLMVNAGQNIISNMRMALFEHVQKLPANYFDRNPTGKLVTRLTNDVNNILEAFAGVVVYLIKDLFLMVGILIQMLCVSRSLTLVLLIPLPFLILSSLYFRVLNRKAFRVCRETMSRLNSFMHESFSGITVLKSFVQEKRRTRRFRKLNNDTYRAQMRSNFISALFIPIVGFFTALPTALLLWYGGMQVLGGVITIGVIFIMINYLRMFYEPITDFSQKYLLMQAAMASAERIFQIMDTPVDGNEKYLSEEESKTYFKGEVKGKIEFRNVSFSYDGKKQILNNISFVIQPGETLALVGDTGSGKTTITSLLCRFYEIDEGQILLDDVDIHTIPISALRHQIAIVMQEPFIFSRTINENIRLATDSISDEDVVRTAKHIGAHDFIMKLPQGYEERLTERGSNLSAGQRQLITFTRALAHARPIIVLDEATASIDSATEHIVQEATLKLLEQRTSIVVAHRLSTIRHAHQILVLRQGEIIEQGNHDTLVAQHGHYAEMIQRQFKVLED